MVGFGRGVAVMLPDQRGDRSERAGDTEQCAPRDARPPCGDAPRRRRRLWCVHGDRFPCQRTRLMTTKWAGNGESLTGTPKVWASTMVVGLTTMATWPGPRGSGLENTRSPGCTAVR